MANYRLSNLDLSTRLALVLEILLPIPQRPWGRVTELAQEYGVSRKFLYTLRQRALEAIQSALVPQPTGPKPASKAITVDRDFLNLAIIVMALMKGSTRDIQWGLQVLFGISRSIGYLSQVLAEAGQRAADYNHRLVIPLEILGEADEIFQGRQPCFTVVDGRSFLVLNLTPADHRDATTWGVTYLELVERGLHFHDMACDGGTGLRAGLKEAQLTIPLRPDLFHLMREAHRLRRRLEKEAYQAIRMAERARRADRETRGLVRRRGRPLKITTPLPEAEAQEAQAIERLDHFVWLLGEIRHVLDPLTPEGRRLSTRQARDTLVTAIELLKTLDHPDVAAFADNLQQHLDELLAPLIWLESRLDAALEGLDEETQQFLLWAWHHREALDLKVEEDIPAPLRQAFRRASEALALFHRSSSLAEALHSWLRPYLQIHRGMPAWLLPLLQFYWNHHRFSRGKRAGKSPLELAGVENVHPLSQALMTLLPQPA